ncbi:MAG: hypothetical protein Q9186_007057 [Xanthomendoza sp. 1 TL-2023]
MRLVLDDEKGPFTSIYNQDAAGISHHAHRTPGFLHLRQKFQSQGSPPESASIIIVRHRRMDQNYSPPANNSSEVFIPHILPTCFRFTRCYNPQADRLCCGELIFTILLRRYLGKSFEHIIRALESLRYHYESNIVVDWTYQGWNIRRSIPRQCPSATRLENQYNLLQWLATHGVQRANLGYELWGLDIYQYWEHQLESMSGQNEVRMALSLYEWLWRWHPDMQGLRIQESTIGPSMNQRTQSTLSPLAPVFVPRYQAPNYDEIHERISRVSSCSTYVDRSDTPPAGQYALVSRIDRAIFTDYWVSRQVQIHGLGNTGHVYQQRVATAESPPAPCSRRRRYGSRQIMRRRGWERSGR